MYYEEAPYAKDVISHQLLDPSDSVQETNHNYIGNHMLYGFKTEVSVQATGFAIGCIVSPPGSVADIELV